MTPQIEKITEQLVANTAGMNKRQTIEYLIQRGIISPTRLQNHAIRTEVDRTVKNGSGRCEAMEAVAETFCCSYAKVRQAVYYKPKF